MIINEEATRAIASQAADIRMPGPEMTLRDPDALNDACTAIAPYWNPDAPLDQGVQAVAVRLAAMLPRLGMIPPRAIEANNAEFQFARVRCLFGGLGYAYHAAIAEALSSIHPQSPLDSTEGRVEWMTRLREARQVCGWPVTLLLIPWAALFSGASTIDGETESPETWQRVVATAQLLKTLRWSSTYGVVSIYQSNVRAFEPPPGTTGIAADKNIAAICAAIGAGGRATKRQNPFRVALSDAVRNANRSDLLPRRALACLPGSVLYGPWSSYAPDAMACEGFFQHGVRLDSVYFASGGQVRPASDLDPSPEDLLGYDWNPSPIADGLRNAKAVWEDQLVRRYDTSHWPSEVLAATFPNLRFLCDAHQSWLDAVLIAQVLRGEVVSLRHEFPLLVFLPSDPTESGSTNQGKSTIAYAVLNALAPGAVLTKVRASASAPDVRAAAKLIERNGTVGLDEFQLPNGHDAMLSRDNLQSLSTGGSVPIGQVLSNDPMEVQLRAPLVINSKALPMPADLVNRSLVYWLNDLSGEQRGNVAAFDSAKSGRLSLLMRLAAIGMAETHSLIDSVLPAAPTGATDGSRWVRIRSLAIAIHRVRFPALSVEAASAAIDEATRRQSESQRKHVQLADQCGTLAVLEAGRSGVARLSGLFEGMTDDECVRTRVFAGMRSRNRPEGATVDDILRARASILGMDDRPLADLVRFLFGSNHPFCKQGSRAILMAFEAEMANRMPEPDTTWMLPDFAGYSGWRLRRGPGVGKMSTYHLENENPAHPAFHGKES